jgi:hypothetical protein
MNLERADTIFYSFVASLVLSLGVIAVGYFGSLSFGWTFGLVVLCFIVPNLLALFDGVFVQKKSS